MTNIGRIRRDFEKKFEQPGYTANEISAIAPSSGERHHQDVLKKYALGIKRSALGEDLGINLEKTDIDLSGSKVRYLIPRSNLGALMERAGIGGTVDELVRKLENSRKISGVNRRIMASRPRGSRICY